MIEDKPAGRSIPVHPFLFAIFPVVALLAANISEVDLEVAYRPAFLALAAAATLYLFAGFLLRRAETGALVVTIWLFIFFSYGHLAATLSGMGLDIGSAHNRYLVVWLLFGCLLSVFVVRTKRDLAYATRALNIMGAVILIMPLLNIAQYEWSRNSTLAERSNQTTESAIKVGLKNTAEYPDIYYLIFDRYSSATELKRTLGFDNSEFTKRLAGRGFFVAEKSRANYPVTYLSISSSLNINYHEKARDQKAMEELLQGHFVYRFLKKRGYKYYHYGSAWPPTHFNRFADMSVNFFKSNFDPFDQMLLKTTMAGPIIDRYQSAESRYGYPLIAQLSALAGVPKMEGPKFVFSHLLLPHQPYEFDANGRPRSEQEQKQRPETELYEDYVKFANKKISSLIDSILVKSKRPPIIIIQADEGFRYDKRRYAKPGYKELHYGILNAFYLPGVDAKKVVYDSITPVNSFRAIFNAYFDGGFKLLPDENYQLITEGDRIKGFRKVTDELRKY